MAKKSFVSSRREKRISVSAESIFSRPLNKRQNAVLSRIAKRQAAGQDSDIDYSDISPLTDEQLAQFRRAPKVLIAARLDRDIYDLLKLVARSAHSAVRVSSLVIALAVFAIYGCLVAPSCISFESIFLHRRAPAQKIKPADRTTGGPRYLWWGADDDIFGECRRGELTNGLRIPGC
jgi:hypothetical protein